jgi:hypothetical protein
MPIQNPQPRSKVHSPVAHRARWAVCLIGVFVLTGCQSQTRLQKPAALPIPPASITSEMPTEAVLQKQITNEIGVARCESDAQCRTLAVGAKACGGPQFWLAWSISNSRETKLRTLADELTVLQRQRLTQSGMVSNCRYIADPGAMCQSHQCVLRAPDSAQ